MTTMWIGDLNQYRAISEMYDIWTYDINSKDCLKPFEEYWNNRIDSPKMGYVLGVAGSITKSAEGSFYMPIQLMFNSNEEQTFWLLKNA
jgi:hypothetical protein